MPLMLFFAAAFVVGPMLIQVSDAAGRRLAKIIDPPAPPAPESERAGRVDGLSPRASGPVVHDDGITIPPRPARAA